MLNWIGFLTNKIEFLLKFCPCATQFYFIELHYIVLQRFYFLLLCKDLEDWLRVALHLMSSCRFRSQLCQTPDVKWPTVHQSTPPWSVLALTRAARTHAKEIQVVPWCVRTTESSISRVLCRGESDVPLQANMASTQGSVTWSNGLTKQWIRIKVKKLEQ